MKRHEHATPNYLPYSVNLYSKEDLCEAGAMMVLQSWWFRKSFGGSIAAGRL
jgi:hypothetical protein